MFHDKQEQTFYSLLDIQKSPQRSDGMHMAMMNILEDLSTERTGNADTYKSMINILEDLQDEITAKNKFLAVLSHELRNPLAPITSTLEYINLLSIKDVVLKENIAILEHQFEVLARLLKDLLDVNRINSGKLRLNFEKVSLKTIIHNALHTTKPLLVQARHSLSVSLPQKPIQFMADPLRLEQIVVNLLSNAIKYTEPGGFIWLKAHTRNNMVIIEVKDTGMGIAPNMMSKIFNIFIQQEELSSRNLRGGLGIGLALVRSLVELHGGTIHASSEGRNRGSTFTLHLPLFLKSDDDNQRSNVKWK